MRRIDGLRGFLLWSAAVGVAFGAIWIAVGTPLMAAISASWVVGAAAMAAWLRRRPEHYSHVLSASMASSSVLVFASAMFTGQGRSPVIAFFVVLPALAAFSEGKTRAVLWTLVSAALTMSLAAMDIVAPRPALVPVPAQMTALMYGSAIGLLGLIAVIARNAWDEANKDLARARDAAFEAADRRMRFLSRMSHEVRTPLHGAIGMTDVLLATDLDDHQREAARVVRRSADGLVEVVDRVLDLARLESEALEVASAELHLLDVVEDTLELFGGAAWGKGIRLSLQIDAGVPLRVWGDRTRLRQVLVNLVGNAMKFTDEGSITVALGFDGTRHELVVQDTGAGVEPAKLSRLFEPFWQENATGEQVGTGLGLALSRRLARRMGGDVQARSVPGVGSTFVFTARLDPLPAEEPAAAGVRYAVVDDGPVPPVFSALARVLGWVAVPLEQARIVVLTPGSAEGVPGLRERNPDATFVLLTSVADTEVRPRAVELGFDQVLFEPARREALVALVEGRDPTGEVAGPLAGGRVLIVDDNPVNLRIAGLMVDRLGLEHEDVSSGEAALERVREARFDIVLMDVMMPGMSGIDTAVAIRASVAHPPILVALSASNLEEQRQACRDAGMVAYLDKPLTLAALAAVLHRHLGRVES